MAGYMKVLPVGAAVLAALGASTISLPCVVYANTATPPKLSAKQAEQIAVKTFSIPSTYSVQNESYNSSNVGTQPASYSLNFQSSDPSLANQSINVTIDANAGNILNYDKPSADHQFVFPVPVSAEKAKQIADSWAKRLYASQVTAVQALPLSRNSGSLTGPTEYTYNYERMVGNLPAPFNGFSITIDQDGNLVSAHDTWSDLSFPKASQAIDSAKADAVYQDALSLHLEYQSVYHIDSKPSTELIYQAAPQNEPNYWGTEYSGGDMTEFPVIDATTGKLIDSLGETYQPQPYSTPTPLDPKGPQRSQPGQPVNWTQSQALNYVEKLLGVSSADTLQSVNQYQNPSSDTTWNFSWHTADDMNMDVTVDATYGYITSYNEYPLQPVSPPAQSTSSAKLTQAQLDQSAADFVKKLFPAETGSLAVIPTPGPKNPNTDLTTSFQVESLTNGIPDTTRGGSLSINSTTGAVQNLWMNTDATHTALPDATKALALDQAKAIWMKDRPLKLEYLETQPQLAGKFAPGNSKQVTQSPQVVLAYAPVAGPSSYGQFNAITGQFETNGNPMPYSGSIGDLAGSPASAELQLLVDRNLISVDSQGDVHPLQTMTHSAFVKLLVDALGFQNRYNPQTMASSAAKSALSLVPPNSPDYHEIGAAYSLGWIPSDTPFDPNALTTRDYAAQILARALGFTPLLAHNDVFKLTASDSGKIDSTHQVGDELAITLGMLPLQNGAFHPNQNVTLADTAHAVVQAAVILGQEGQPYPPGPRPLH